MPLRAPNETERARQEIVSGWARARRPRSAAEGLFEGDRLAHKSRCQFVRTHKDGFIDLRARRPRDDKIMEAEPFASAQIDIDAVTENRMDQLAAIADSDQSCSVGGVATVAAGKAEPFLQRDAGIVQIDERVGGSSVPDADWKCLKMLIHCCRPGGAGKWQEGGHFRIDLHQRRKSLIQVKIWGHFSYNGSGIDGENDGYFRAIRHEQAQVHT